MGKGFRDGTSQFISPQKPAGYFGDWRKGRERGEWEARNTNKNFNLGKFPMKSGMFPLNRLLERSLGYEKISLKADRRAGEWRGRGEGDVQIFHVCQVCQNIRDGASELICRK